MNIVYDATTGQILANPSADQDVRIVAQHYDNAKWLQTNVEVDVLWHYQVDLDTLQVVEAE